MRVDLVNRKTILTAVAAAGLACGGEGEGPGQAGGGPGGSGGRPGLPVEVAIVRADTVVDAILATGTIEAVQSIELRPELQGRLNEILVQEGSEVTAGAPLFKVDDAVYAIGDRCSHAEASLAEGPLFGTGVECPRHGSEFDLSTGEPSGLPATKPVPTYDTRIDDGVVYLDLPEDAS